MALRRVIRSGHLAPQRPAWPWMLALGGLLLCVSSPVLAQEEQLGPKLHQKPKSDPSFMHGLGEAVAGATITLPKAVLDGLLTGPPVVGPMIGLLGGAARASQMVVEGVIEMSAGFDPFGFKRQRL